MTTPTPQEFMEKVLAWPGPQEPGYVNVHWFSPRDSGMRGRAFRNIQDFMSFVAWGVTKPSIMTDIYFCLSLQSHIGKTYNGKASAARSSHNALKLKAIWLDIDVKDTSGYPTLGDALAALTAFCTTAQIPGPSAVVLSGGGLHVYWISTLPLLVGDWIRYANALRQAAMHSNLRCDYGVTTDAARVLRVPGTFNFKTVPPRAVRIAAMGQEFDFAVAFGDLVRKYPSATAQTQITSSPFDLSLFPKKPVPPEGIESLSQGIDLYEDKLLDPKGVFKFCPHFDHVYQTAGKDCSQGLWMLDVLSTTFMEDGRNIAHRISRDHKGYTTEATNKMYDRKLSDRTNYGLGWPGCQAFENEGSTQCATCVYRGKIKSPLNLGCFTASAPTSSMITPVLSDSNIDFCGLPTGYVLSEKGQITKLVQKRVGGVLIEEPAVLFKCRLSDFWCQSGTRAIRFVTSLDGDNTNDVVIWEEEIGHAQLLQDKLRKQGVKPNPPNKHLIEDFLTSFMEKYDAEKQRISTLPFGWMVVENTRQGFVYGGRFVQRDGKITRAGYSEESLEQYYRPKGTIEPWIELLKVVTARKHPALEAIVATSFAAPLMFIPGLYNGVFCAYSHGGGAHKSTSMSLGMGVWANPKMAKENTLSSMVGLLKKMGHLRNLPIYWDEINNAEKMEQVRSIVSYATEGRAGTKLFQNREIRPIEEWETMITIGANVSLWNAIARKSKDTDSDFQRVFELEVDKLPDSANAIDVQRLTAALDRNYGHMGLKYSEFLGRNPDGVFKVGDSILRSFQADTGAKSEHRFRMSMAAMTVAGAALANQMGATFNVEDIYVYMKQQFLRQNAEINRLNVVGGSIENTAMLLAEFLKAHLKNTFISETLPRTGAGRKTVIRVSGPDPLRGDPVHIFGARSEQTIRISRSCLTKYIETGGKFSVNGVLNGLVKHYKAKLNADHVNLAAGTGLQGIRESIIEIPVPPDSPLRDFLFSDGEEHAEKHGATNGSSPPKSKLVEDLPLQPQKDLEFVKERLAETSKPN